MSDENFPGPLLEIIDLKKEYHVSPAFFRRSPLLVPAVDGVDLEIHSGETLGLVGESGCGKTTLGRLILKLLDPTDGIINFAGQNIFTLTGGELKNYRRQVQMIFQDPYASLNPRRNAFDTIKEPLVIHGLLHNKEAYDYVLELIDLVGLTREQLERYPHEFSGGQRQRIGIARALALRPKLVVTDEPVSSLDVSIQAQILNLLKSLQEKFNLTYLFITHDLSVVRYMASRVAVMYLGKIVELTDNEELFSRPLHPYTRILLESVPQLKPGPKKKLLVSTEKSSARQRQGGCPFHPRCPEVKEMCLKERPQMRFVFGNHRVACHLY